MKKITLVGLAVLLVISAIVSCKKKKSGDEGGCGEQKIKVTTIPAINTVDPPSPGSEFPLVVNIETMPTAGATVIINAKSENNGQVYFTDTIKNPSTSNSLSIKNTPVGVSCLVTVNVISATCNTNTFSGTYRYTAK